MSQKFDFVLSSPAKTLLERPVSMVVLPASEGDIGVLANHAPLMSSLRPGIIKVFEDDDILIKIFANGGFCKITSEHCVVLISEGISLETLNQSSLEIEIKNLIEGIAESETYEERKEKDRSLTIAKTKLMELLTHKKNI